MDIPETTVRRRILIADDQPLMRQGVKEFFNRHEDLLVCAEANDVPAASSALDTLHLDLAIFALRLPDGDVLELIKSARGRFKSLKILVFSQHNELVFAERALRAGAHGYVCKQEEPLEVVSAVRKVLAGELYVSRSLASSLLGKLLHARASLPVGQVDGLSDRELQVFQMLGSGLSSRQISENLRLSVKTIETYRENIKRKFSLKTSAELLQYATRWVQESSSKVIHPENLPLL